MDFVDTDTALWLCNTRQNKTEKFSLLKFPLNATLFIQHTRNMEINTLVGIASELGCYALLVQYIPYDDDDDDDWWSTPSPDFSL